MFQGDIDDMIVIFFIYSDSLYTNLDVKEEELQEQKDEVCLRFSALFPSDCSLRSWQTAHNTAG